MWASLGKKLDLEPPVPIGENTYLGCGQEDVLPPQDLISEKSEMFKELFSKKAIPTDPTPEEAAIFKLLDKNFTLPAPTTKNKVKAYQYVMKGHAEQCVEKYLELSKKTIDSIKQVATPCIDDHQLSPEGMITKGALASVAACIVLKVLYLARVARPDLLWSVDVFAREGYSLDCSL